MINYWICMRVRSVFRVLVIMGVIVFKGMVMVMVKIEISVLNYNTIQNTIQYHIIWGRIG